MTLPPDEIPEGLTARQYEKLGLQYLLMGLSGLASEAMSRSWALYENSDKERPAFMPDEEMKFGANMISALVELVHRLETLDSEANNADEAFADFKSELEGMGAEPHETREFIDKIKESLSDSAAPPPREVPSGLSADEYLELGISYKQLGWTEQSRDALLIAGQAAGETGTKARRFLRTKLPRQPVPLFAEQRNIEGYNFMVAGNLNEAMEVFQSLNRDYPEFEWPWGNLASVYVQRGDLERAAECVDRALSISPDYVNAWLHRARIEALNENYRASNECLDRAAELDPEDRSIARIADLIRKLEELK